MERTGIGIKCLPVDNGVWWNLLKENWNWVGTINQENGILFFFSLFEWISWKFY